MYELSGQVFVLDPADADHIDLALGMTINAAQLGANINVQRSGVVDDSAWSWATGPIWLGPEGIPTQTPPGSEFDLYIGAAVSSTRIILNIQDPIDLE